MSKFSKPSPALVLAFVALFAALVGGAYAATAAKNSVKTKSIKNLAVTNPKLAPDAVTGDKVVESSLGQVPSAAEADNASKLGGEGAAKYQKFCEPGTIKGSLVIQTNGSMPNSFQNAVGFNCAQPGNVTTSVQIRRNGLGDYNVKFLGLESSGSSVVSGNTTAQGVTSSDGQTPGEFRVQMGNAADGKFSLVVF